MHKFWHIVEQDIRLGRMQCQVILVMLLGWIKLLQRHKLRDYGSGESVRSGKLQDYILRDFLLLCIGEENSRTVLVAGIRPLAVDLGWIVRHAEKYLKQLLVGNLRRVEADAHRFGMSGIAIAYLFVMRRRRIAARVARHHLGHSLDVFKHRIDAPEATSGEYCRLFGWRCGGI